MTSPLRRVLSRWRSHTRGSIGDRAYVLYTLVMVTLVVALPCARFLWVAVTGEAGQAALRSDAAPSVTALVAGALWAGALMLGRERGPALRPPFLTHVLASSDAPRETGFLGPVLRAGGLVTALTSAAAALVAGGLVDAGSADLLDAAQFIGAGLLTGVITVVAWLAGQALPRRASISLGGLLLVASLATTQLPTAGAPWGWVGMAYPGEGSPGGLIALVAMTTMLMIATPALMRLLRRAELLEQAMRWDRATTFAAGMDFSAAVGLYRLRPHLGRGLNAVRPGLPWWAVSLRRDAIGALRTPGRLLVASVALSGAGGLITLAFSAVPSGVLAGGVAGLLIYFALGALTDGLRYAVSAAADLPLYGVSDDRLLAGHLLFPIVACWAIVVTAGALTAALGGISLWATLLCALAVPTLVLVLRVGTAHKGALPEVLLTPIPSAFGDLGGVLRALWAAEGILCAALIGGAAALVLTLPFLVLAVGCVVCGVALGRWLRRRAL